MRLLSTDRAELHYFPSPEDVPDGYAILSHVWDKKEETFQDLDALRVKCAMSGDNPRGFVSNKIRRSCTLAEKHGYKWIWIDTCCIDKSSSAELSEAINSMYRYYALSSVCYAFLRDVEAQRDMEHSVWYRRGWTLQELIAPKLLVFVSKGWKVLGTKGDLAFKISCQTKIPEDVLQYEKDLAQVPVGQRMSWASGRETTRVEDRAYSLMGIFGINMPTLYGEGQNAFYRLQEEIMKVSTDSTLFAWGNYEVTTSSLNDYAIDKLVLCEDPQVSRHHSSHPCKHTLLNERVLLASSPSEFSLGPMYLRNDDKILVSCITDHVDGIAHSNGISGRVGVNNGPFIRDDSSRNSRIPPSSPAPYFATRVRCATVIRQVRRRPDDWPTAVSMLPCRLRTTENTSISCWGTTRRTAYRFQRSRQLHQTSLDEVLYLRKAPFSKHPRHLSPTTHAPSTQLLSPVSYIWRW